MRRCRPQFELEGSVGATPSRPYHGKDNIHATLPYRKSLCSCLLPFAQRGPKRSLRGPRCFLGKSVPQSSIPDPYMTHRRRPTTRPDSSDRRRRDSYKHGRLRAVLPGGHPTLLPLVVPLATVNPFMASLMVPDNLDFPGTIDELMNRPSWHRWAACRGQGTDAF